MYRRIMVPLDGSELAQSVVEHALELARALDATLVLLHVRTSRTGSKEAAQRYLEFVRAQISARGVPIELVVANGAIAASIMRAADEETIDLIAMATHGRTGVQRAVRGSVAEEVLRQSNKPVLLIRVLEAKLAQPAPHARQRTSEGAA
jgi:nucleotide-binding universal stress UspA family protein